jgi:hypothetical protein
MSEEFIECLHCGRDIPASDVEHWRCCDEHPARRAFLAERARAEKAEAALDDALAGIAQALDLKLPDPQRSDPVHAIVLDIGRLLGVQQRWTDACELARQYCPVDSGESHIKDGIPKLAARAERAEEQRDRAKRAAKLALRAHQIGGPRLDEIEALLDDVGPEVTP